MFRVLTAPPLTRASWSGRPSAPTSTGRSRGLAQSTKHGEHLRPLRARSHRGGLETEASRGAASVVGDPCRDCGDSRPRDGLDHDTSSRQRQRRRRREHDAQRWPPRAGPPGNATRVREAPRARYRAATRQAREHDPSTDASPGHAAVEGDPRSPSSSPSGRAAARRPSGRATAPRGSESAQSSGRLDAERGTCADARAVRRVRR
jgi:hypothetical protein